MAAKQTSLETPISVQQCGDLFQQLAVQNAGRGVKLKGGLEFFTPRDDSPFSAIDEDPPSFSVGVWIPKAGVSKRLLGVMLHDGDMVKDPGSGRAMQMFVWDRGAHREVCLAAPHGMSGGAAQKLLQTFVAGFQRAGNGARP